MQEHAAEPVPHTPPPLAAAPPPAGARPEDAGACGPGDVPAPRDAVEVRAHDGASIFLRRHGNPDGPRLVVSHGNGLAADAYYPFWSLLTDRFDVVLYDFRNHGWNPLGDPGAHLVESFIRDNACVATAIDRCFGRRPRVGVFHSTSALTAILPGAERNGYSGLVLFDPPIFHSGRDRRDVLLGERLARRLARTARTRRERFRTWEELAQTYRDGRAFTRLCPGAAELLARATSRRSAGGDGYELCCPRNCEAEIFAQTFRWSRRVDLDRLQCPVKVIGGDPAVPFSFLPSVDLDEIVALDYDFVPDTTHFLQLEDPAACAFETARFIERALSAWSAPKRLAGSEFRLVPSTP